MELDKLNLQLFDSTDGHALDAAAIGVHAHSLDHCAPKNLREQQIAELEAVLANTSFAHEYAIMHLDKTDNERERDSVYDELERYHQTYTDTRKLLEDIDRDRLIRFEAALAWQKNTVLRGYQV